MSQTQTPAPSVAPVANIQVVPNALTKAILDLAEDETFPRNIDPVPPVLAPDEWDVLKKVTQEDVGNFDDILHAYPNFSDAGIEALTVMQDDMIRLGLSMSDMHEFSDNLAAWNAKYPFTFGENMQKSFADVAFDKKLGDPLVVLHQNGYDPLSWTWKFHRNILKANEMDILAPPIKVGEEEVTLHLPDLLLQSCSTSLIQAGMAMGALQRVVDKTTLFEVQTFAFDTRNDKLLDEILRNGGDPHVKDTTNRDRDFIHCVAMKATIDDIPCMDVLSKNGADWNVGDNFQTTPLLMSVYRGETDVANWIAQQNGVDVHVRSRVFGDLERIASEGPARVIQRREEIKAAMEHYAEEAKKKSTDPNFSFDPPEVPDYPATLLPLVKGWMLARPPLASSYAPIVRDQNRPIELIEMSDVDEEMANWEL
jgi:hypothetical protein